MFDVGVPELMLILIVALLFLGPSRLPEIGSALGKAITEFRRGTREGAEAAAKTAATAGTEETTRS